MTAKCDAFEFDDRRVFQESAIRLYAALIGRGYSNIPPPATLHDSLCEWFTMQDFQLARALTQPAHPIDWHLIRIGSAGAPLMQAIDALTIAPSLVRAFAGLQLAMDHARVFAHAVTHIDQGIGLLARDGVLIAAIEPIALQPPDLVKREYVSALIEGLRIHRDWISLTQRLSSLPGLKNRVPPVRVLDAAVVVGFDG
jgi:hypothetical protein